MFVGSAWACSGPSKTVLNAEVSVRISSAWRIKLALIDVCTANTDISIYRILLLVAIVVVRVNSRYPRDLKTMVGLRRCEQLVDSYHLKDGLLFALLMLVIPAFAQDGNEIRGQALYENQCSECHDSNIHQRDARRATSLKELRVWVLAMVVHAELDWTMEEVDDVTLYLSRQLYDF